ncbi:MAG: SGNH/GDSL hydrolase family protein [Planctomycetes bacterium]|nr:SGNH/GDSL hydrolase family protein [Planctomycetota bacterium]
MPEPVWVPKLWFALGGLLVALVGVEAVVRLRQWQRYGTTLTSYYHFATDPATGLRIPEPGHSVGPIAIDSLGFRGPELERPKPPLRIRVAFLGASTTFCAEASAREATWPHLVVEGLKAAAPELEFDYVNGGVGGFTVSDSLLSLEHRVAPLEPDVIVYYEATNDLTVDTRRLAIEAGLYEAGEGEPSSIGDWWLTWYLVEKNLELRWRTHRGADELLRFDPRALSRPFEERLTRLVRAAKERAQVVLLVTFSTRMRPGQLPEVQRAGAASALYYMPFLDLAGLLAGYAEYNRVIRAVAGATGAILVEGEDSIPGDATHFADSVHFRDPGLVLQARRVLHGLLAAPAYQELVARRQAGAGD